MREQRIEGFTFTITKWGPGDAMHGVMHPRYRPEPERPADDKVSFLINEAAFRCAIPSSAVRSHNRSTAPTKARHAVFLALRHEGLSYTDIGRAVGGRDHTTVLHGCRRGVADPKIAQLAADISEALREWVEDRAQSPAST